MIREVDNTLGTLILLGADLINFARDPRDTYKTLISIKQVFDPITARYNYFKLRLDRLFGWDSTYHWDVVQKILEIRQIIRAKVNTKRLGTDGVRFIVRVDDFPRWDIPTELYRDFHDIFVRYSIPYLLGVTPHLCQKPLDPTCNIYRKLTDSEIILLEEVARTGAELAIHGYSHKTRQARPRSELIGATSDEIRKNIENALTELREIGFEVDIFIPPFNTIDRNSFLQLSDYFSLICGGPESIRWLGLTLSPAFLDGTLYVPSYSPAYGQANVLTKFVEKLEVIKDSLVIPLTLHWAWEKEDGFVGVKNLCQRLRGRLITWRSLKETYYATINSLDQAMF